MIQKDFKTRTAHSLHRIEEITKEELALGWQIFPGGIFQTRLVQGRGPDQIAYDLVFVKYGEDPPGLKEVLAMDEGLEREKALEALLPGAHTCPDCGCIRGAHLSSCSYLGHGGLNG